MKMHQTLLAGGLAALGMFSFPVLSQAVEGQLARPAGQHCQRSADDRAMHGFDRMADRLKLSPEQRKSMLAIKDKYQPQMRDLRQSLSGQRDALSKIEADDAKLPEAAAAQGKTIADLIVLRKQMRGEMDKVLTEEQRQTMSKMMQHRGRHHRHAPMLQG